MSSAGRGHNEGTAGFTLVPWLPCTVWGRAAGRTSAWAPCNTSQPSYRAQPRPCSTSHLTQQLQGDFVAPLTHPSSVAGPSLLPPQPCPSRAAAGAEPWALLQQQGYLSPSASSWLHTAPPARLGPGPAPRARLGEQAGGDSFPKHLKETEPPFSHARQELSHPLWLDTKCSQGQSQCILLTPGTVWI